MLTHMHTKKNIVLAKDISDKYKQKETSFGNINVRQVGI